MSYLSYLTCTSLTFLHKQMIIKFMKENILQSNACDRLKCHITYQFMYLIHFHFNNQDEKENNKSGKNSM